MENDLGDIDRMNEKDRWNGGVNRVRVFRRRGGDGIVNDSRPRRAPDFYLRHGCKDGVGVVVECQRTKVSSTCFRYSELTMNSAHTGSACTPRFPLGGNERRAAFDYDEK